MATKKVKETVEAVKTEAVETAKKISKKAEPTVEAAKNTLKTVSEKAEPAVKKAKSAAKKAGEAAASATDAAISAGKKAAAKLVSEVYVEYGGSKFDCTNVTKRCIDDFKAKHKGEIVRTCRVYIKPEDGMVYYVINELADKFAL